MGILDKITNFVNGAELSTASYKPPYTGSLPSKTVKKGTRNADAKKVQKFLNWCIGAGLKVDGYCGTNTVSAIRKFQKKYKLKVDGVFGSQCRKKAKKIVKAYAPTPSPSPVPEPVQTTNAEKIVAKALEYTWAYGTSESKYKYPKGSAKSVYKTALKKYMKKKAKISQTDCGYFVSTCVRASGTSSSFRALPSSYKKAYPKVPSEMSVVHKGKITDGVLLAGDVIRYKKKSGQHTVIYIGNGKIAHASRKHAFPRISKSKPWNNSNVKKTTIQVLRAK